MIPPSGPVSGQWPCFRLVMLMMNPGPLYRSLAPTCPQLSNRLQLSRFKGRWLSCINSSPSKGFHACAFTTASRATRQIPAVSGMDPHEDLYHYQSGRWLYNEAEQLAKRYVKFDVPALHEVAANAVGCGCTGIEKLAEGFYNKTFSLTMNDGQELIAKIPNANAGPPGITVASEAATMTFLRTVLDVPVPEVCAWSSLHSASNPVGTEFLIMKKAEGRQLSEIWTGMSDAHKSELIKNLVSVEARMAKSRLKNYGSIYFRGSVGNCNDTANDILIDSVGNEGSRFVVGSTVERSFWRDGRDGLDIDRGPWSTIQAYFSATASREIAWLRNLESKAGPMMKTTGETYASTPSIHIRLLEQFLSVVPFILPKDQFIGYPTLWHTDLHGDNIFVDPTNPSKITSIIDWQSTSANPFFMQARFPSIFDCDWPYPWGAVVPRLPENYDHLPPNVQEKERQRYRDVRLKKHYELASRKFNPLVFRALDTTREEGENDVQISTLLAIVGRTWLDGPIPLRDVLIQIFENWGHFSADTACPIYFSQEEIARSKEEAKRWAAAYEEFDTLRMELVGGMEGWVSHEEYEDAKRRYEENKDMLDELRQKLELAGGGEG